MDIAIAWWRRRPGIAAIRPILDEPKEASEYQRNAKNYDTHRIRRGEMDRYCRSLDIWIRC